MNEIIICFYKILKSDLLCRNLIFIPNKGALIEEISLLEKSLPFPLCLDHTDILRNWDGINLEVIKVYAVTKTDELPQMIGSQICEYPDLIFFASDITGIVFGYDYNYRVYSLDSEGSTLAYVADSLVDFFCDFIFGKKSEYLMGSDWLNDLEKFKII